jgi:ligand-binding sensor domain-containing protein
LPTAEIPPSQYLRFARLTAKDGLSTDQTFHSAQYRYGFMWFATIDGLNRYDGAKFKIYRHDPDDPSSLSNNVVRAMIVDQNGIPWLGTFGGGLNQYDPKKDAFIRYQHDSDDPRGPSMRTGRGWSGVEGD